MPVLKYVEFSIFKKTSGSTDKALVRVMPSEIASANIPIWRFMASLTEWAIPFSPKKKTCFAIVSKIFLQLLNTVSSPDAIRINSPFIATLGPPITGISSIVMPKSLNFFAVFLDSMGFNVLISATTKFSCLPSIIPNFPNDTSLRA